MIYEEITEDILNEKLITYGNRKPYGQVVFVAGGAGSGKGFAISNFLDSSSFKIRDVDEMKKQLQILNRLGKIDINTIIKKHGKSIKPKDVDLINKIQDEGFKLQNLNLKNPDHVYALHILVDAMGIKDKTLHSLLSGKNNPETLPNILFDITAKKITSITSVIADLKKAGYKADNIHLTWILTNYVTAMVNNRNRARMVPEDILLQTHEGASNTIWGIVTKALPKGMNGRIDVILNNPEHTVFYTDDDGKTINGKVKGFKSLPLKKAKGGIYAEAVWKKLLFSWVKGNAPESITANMKESVQKESVITERQFKGLDGIDDKTPLTKISDTQKLKIIQGTGNIISFKVPKGSDRNFWQVISKGKIKKQKDLSNNVVYILPGKMIGSPKFKSIKDLIKGVDWVSVEKARRFNESVVSEDSPESAHPQGSDKLTNRTIVMDMLDVISHMKFGPDYHKLTTSQKKEVHKEAIKGYLINDKPFKESVNEAGVNVWYFYKKANKDKNKFFKMLSDFRKKHSDTVWIKMLNYALEDFNENPTKYKTIDDKQNILFKNLQTNKKAYE